VEAVPASADGPNLIAAGAIGAGSPATLTSLYAVEIIVLALTIVWHWGSRS